MERNTKEYTLLNQVLPVAVTSSTDATPIVMTVTAHGLLTGQKVLIQGHTTNIAANGIFLVKAATANTFALGDRYTGADVAGSGAGAGSSGFCMLAPTVILVEDFRNVVFSVFTSGTSTMTTKFYGSIGKPDVGTVANLTQNDPNFGATVSAINPYSAIQIINLDTGSTLNGATGIVLSGADTQTMYEANINVLKYLTAFPVTWSGGTITIKAIVTGNL